MYTFNYHKQCYFYIFICFCAEKVSNCDSKVKNYKIISLRNIIDFSSELHKSRVYIASHNDGVSWIKYEQNIYSSNIKVELQRLKSQCSNTQVKIPEELT